MKVKMFLIILIVILLGSLCFGDEYWESIYTSDSNIYSLAINAYGDLFAGTQGGVYKSTNNGIDWECVGLENVSVYSLTINSNGYIIAGTGGLYNIYRSTDNGENWIPVNDNPGNGNIIMLYINTNYVLYAASWGKIYKSTDAGENWELIYTTSETEAIYSIIENSEGVLFAGTTDFIDGIGGVYKSIDDGDTWEHIGLEYEYVCALAINPSGEIFACSRGNVYNFEGGIFRSSDNGDTWTKLLDYILATSIAINSNGVIFMGCSELDAHVGAVHISEDNGDNWTLIESTLMPSNVGIEFVTISVDNYVYAISYGGTCRIYRSIDPLLSIEKPHIDESDIMLYNSPNPCSDFTIIKYSIAGVPDYLPVEINVYNILGQYMDTIEGRYGEATWHTKNYLDGVYFFEINQNDYREICKTVVVH